MPLSGALQTQITLLRHPQGPWTTLLSLLFRYLIKQWSTYEDENHSQNLKRSEAAFLALRVFIFCVLLMWLLLFFYPLVVSLFSILWMPILFSVQDSWVFVCTLFSLWPVSGAMTFTLCQASTQPSCIVWLQSTNVTMIYTKLTS